MQKKPFCLKKRGDIWYRNWYDYTHIPPVRHWISTECSSYNDAFNKCLKLAQEGRLNPETDYKFASYASTFFDEDSLYMQDVKLRSSKTHQAMSYSYWLTCRQIVKNHLNRLFCDYSIKEFTPKIIIKGRIKLSCEGLSNHTINNIISVLNKILETAFQNGLISRNPCKSVKPLLEDENIKGTFLINESRNILRSSWPNENSRKFNTVAALTGARLSEINAFRAENLNDDYIEVKDQFLKGQLRPTKTQKSRIIPLCPEVHDLIASNMKNGVFCDDIYESRPSDDLREVLQEIMPEKRKSQSLSFHSWRHFFNTFLLSKGIAPIKVASVLGHSTKDISTMTIRYCNFSVVDFTEIIEAQRELFHLLCD